ncbi:MAG TPA: hypothetical protein VMU81_18450 [Acetobacteraceae bacterium]|nr:hypothetical protein [Acetobacteraceae bacterium]
MPDLKEEQNQEPVSSAGGGASWRRVMAARHGGWASNFMPGVLAPAEA